MEDSLETKLVSYNENTCDLDQVCVAMTVYLKHTRGRSLDKSVEEILHRRVRQVCNIFLLEAEKEPVDRPAGDAITHYHNALVESYPWFPVC